MDVLKSVSIFNKITEPKVYTIYHGSNVILEKPAYRPWITDYDYGPGFYCSEDEDMSDIWCDKYCNKYTIDTTNLHILSLEDNDEDMLFMMALLLKFRRSLDSKIFDRSDLMEKRDMFIEQYFRPIDDYDIIVGYRVDSSFSTIAIEFLKGTLGVNDLRDCITSGKYGYQFVLVSQRSFDILKYQSYKEKVSDSDTLTLLNYDGRYDMGLIIETARLNGPNGETIFDLLEVY